MAETAPQLGNIPQTSELKVPTVSSSTGSEAPASTGPATSNANFAESAQTAKDNVVNSMVSRQKSGMGVNVVADQTHSYRAQPIEQRPDLMSGSRRLGRRKLYLEPSDHAEPQGVGSTRLGTYCHEAYTIGSLC